MKLPSPGAHVRITIEGTVQSAQSCEVELVTGTRITSRSPDVQLEILRPGFQPGDVVWDGSRNLLRVAPAGDEPHWIAPNGISVHDDEHDPSRLHLIASADQQTQAAPLCLCGHPEDQHNNGDSPECFTCPGRDRPAHCKQFRPA
ncbi:hypothetical protein [Streptomyces decoyicus]|uniref:hypothetical protein n=1 Tax=Streptomyces decoyicus TaxID=249567 RepID=UPI0033A61FA8